MREKIGFGVRFFVDYASDLGKSRVDLGVAPLKKWALVSESETGTCERYFSRSPLIWLSLWIPCPVLRVPEFC